MYTPRVRLTLALVTCGPQLEAALAGPSLRAASVIRLAGVARRSSLVLAALDLLLEDAGEEPAAVERVLVTRGPGSFTGIRAGLATVHGLQAANAVEVVAYGSLVTQAARCPGPSTVWAAQPGRRGELYVQRFVVDVEGRPRPETDIRIVAVDEAAASGPWIASEALDLGGATRADATCTAAEALLRLDTLGAAAEPLEPFYVEEPPIHTGSG